MSDSLYLVELLLRKRATLSHRNSFFRLRTAYRQQQKFRNVFSLPMRYILFFHFERKHSQNQQAQVPFSFVKEINKILPYFAVNLRSPLNGTKNCVIPNVEFSLLQLNFQ